MRRLSVLKVHFLCMFYILPLPCITDTVIFIISKKKKNTRTWKCAVTSFKVTQLVNDEFTSACQTLTLNAHLSRCATKGSVEEVKHKAKQVISRIQYYYQSSSLTT